MLQIMPSSYSLCTVKEIRQRPNDKAFFLSDGVSLNVFPMEIFCAARFTCFFLESRIIDPPFMLSENVLQTLFTAQYNLSNERQRVQ
jgi:hypothetical protein